LALRRRLTRAEQIEHSHTSASGMWVARPQTSQGNSGVFGSGALH
jgi:hypothetical protein